VLAAQQQGTDLAQAYEGSSVGKELNLLGAGLREGGYAALHTLLADDLDPPITRAHLQAQAPLHVGQERASE
jgi:hypothetical protein